jgi:aminopeptidase N
VGEYYRRHQAGGGSSAAFVQVAKDVSSIDLTAFFDEWLFSSRWGTVVSAAKRPSDLYERHRRKAMKSPESGAP